MFDESERRFGNQLRFGNRLKRRRTVDWAAFTATRRVGTWLGGLHVVRAAAITGGATRFAPAMARHDGL